MIQTPIFGRLQNAMKFPREIIFLKVSTRCCRQFIFIFIPKFQVDVAEEFVHVSELQDLLEGHNEYELKFIVQFVLQGQAVMIEWIWASSFLRRKSRFIKIEVFAGAEPSRTPFVDSYSAPLIIQFIGESFFAHTGHRWPLTHWHKSDWKHCYQSDSSHFAFQSTTQNQFTWIKMHKINCIGLQFS